MFRAEPEWLQTLKKHGITHLNLANNHSIDQGREGLLDTKRNIEQAGMVAVGAGRNMQEAAAPVLLAAQPRRVYLFVSQRLPLENFAYLPDRPSVSQESMDSLCARIRWLKEQEPDCYVIVNVHWGWEHHMEPTLKQRQEAHRMVCAGADLIIGHHTHTLQTVETWQGTPIYYSLGNFIFDLDNPINTRTCVVKVLMTKDCVTINALPVEIRQCVPYVLRSEDQEEKIAP
jgi:poly-gamma-glutamate synthesis protein (capsule biosynthesis protein)